ncbi:hypothetical protein SAMN04487981_125103 [Streptomyces sp. cf386]|uniref:SoxR reducing system RseC family protein n=1 Tax=Streptomyces sp. cf386 TaxID=1761904 RepID=UPI0008914674|nr:SoxR reducing system RseC family protein [Streptomyces sp. cf386]SDP53194.1 hypothetical protein SAMN04487981_125103 [Streptomyces sp. cf386]
MARSEVPTWLQGAMDRELYRHNAFRISGLAVTATPRAVRRRVSEARAAEALGAERAGRPAAGETRWLPPDPMPDHNAVREALRRLEDPVRRVVDEFFWFWPLPESDGTELARARKAWERLAGSRAEDAGDPGARSIAVHNLAVLHHAEALEAKEFYGARGLRTLWERAYRYWRQVLDDDGCWRRLDERIRVLDDPRLRVVDGTALREALPAVLLDLHARLAVDAARRKGGEDAALQHVSLMRGFTVNDGPAGAGSVDDGLVDAALRRVTAPFAAAVRHRTEAIPGPGADPVTLDRAADSLLAETRADVRVLRTVLGAKHPVSADAADEVATAVNGCAVACANSLSADRSTARDPRVSRAAAHLRSARVLAASGHVRTLVEQNLAVLLSNDILLDCKEAVERGGRSPRDGAARASRMLDTVEPRLRELRELRPHAPETSQVRDAVAMAACRLYTEYVNTTRDLDRALPGYRRVLPLAAGEEARSVIRQNIDTLTRAAAGPAVAGTPGQCFRCGRSVGASEVLAVTGGSLADSGSVGIPCCAGCRYEAMDLLDRAGLAPDPYPPATTGYRPRAARRGGALLAFGVALIALLEGALIGGALLVGPETTAGKWLSGGAFLIGWFVVTGLADLWENRKK